MAFDRKDGSLTVRNKYFHKPLKGYTLYLVSLAPGGKHAVERMALPETAPGKSVTVKLPSAAMQTGSLMVLADARFKLPEDVKELSAKQLEHVADRVRSLRVVPGRRGEGGFREGSRGAAAVSVRQGDPVVVQGKGFSASFKDGQLSALRYGSQDLILPGYPVALQAYRSPVDNDAWIRSKVEGKMKMQTMKAEYSDVKAAVISPGVARITAQFRTKGSGLSFSGEVAWTVFGNGVINASVRMYPSAKGEELLRLGVTFGMPAAYDQVEYLGLGPWDNYRDRRTSCWKDVFRTSVDDMFFAYSRPQDMGNRMETDWVALSRPKAAPALWVGSASPRGPAGSVHPALYAEGAQQRQKPGQAAGEGQGDRESGRLPDGAGRFLLRAAPPGEVPDAERSHPPGLCAGPHVRPAEPGARGTGRAPFPRD